MNKPVKSFLSRTFKLDGWLNLLAGFGKKNTDKTKDTQYEAATVLCESELTNLWIGDGLGARIVSAPADDMTRKWITIPEDPEEKILKELDRLNAEEAFNEALKWMRLYQGAVIVMGIQGSGELEDPIPSNIKGIDYLKVYPSSRIHIDSTDFVDDSKSPYFGDIEVFRIEGITGVPIRVHRSRCLVFKGIPVPGDNSESIDLKMRYWGLSALNQIWDRLKNFGATEQGIANLMYEVVIGKYTLSNLAELLSEGNTEAVYARMEIINASKSLINSVLLGEGESYTRDTANLTGIPEVIDRMMMMLSGTSNIPVTRLFGRSPAGQNATGESDLRNYYDGVVAGQKSELKPPLQKLVILINSYLNATNDPTIEFNSVWEMTDKEKADLEKVHAETDQIYIVNGVLTPEEVTEMRFPDLEGVDRSTVEEEDE